MDYMKISFEDIKSAEEFFENDANLANFLLNVYRFYSKTELKPKNSEVKRYLKVYEKTMKRVLIASENGKKNISKRIDNQQVNEVLLEAKSKPPLKGTQSKGVSDPISTPSDLPSTNNKVLSIKTKEKEKENIKRKDTPLTEVRVDPSIFDFSSLYQEGEVMLIFDDVVKIKSSMFESLLEKYGKQSVMKKIESLSTGIHNKNRKYMKYKDHGRTIRNWLSADDTPTQTPQESVVRYKWEGETMHRVVKKDIAENYFAQQLQFGKKPILL